MVTATSGLVLLISLGEVGLLLAIGVVGSLIAIATWHTWGERIRPTLLAVGTWLRRMRPATKGDIEDVEARVDASETEAEWLREALRELRREAIVRDQRTALKVLEIEDPRPEEPEDVITASLRKQERLEEIGEPHGVNLEGELTLDSIEEKLDELVENESALDETTDED